jgi:hypothetical protein
VFEGDLHFSNAATIELPGTPLALRHPHCVLLDSENSLLRVWKFSHRPPELEAEHTVELDDDITVLPHVAIHPTLPFIAVIIKGTTADGKEQHQIVVIDYASETSRVLLRLDYAHVAASASFMDDLFLNIYEDNDHRLWFRAWKLSSGPKNAPPTYKLLREPQQIFLFVEPINHLAFTIHDGNHDTKLIIVEYAYSSSSHLTTMMALYSLNSSTGKVTSQVSNFSINQSLNLLGQVRNNNNLLFYCVLESVKTIMNDIPTDAIKFEVVNSNTGKKKVPSRPTIIATRTPSSLPLFAPLHTVYSSSIFVLVRQRGYGVYANFVFVPASGDLTRARTSTVKLPLDMEQLMSVDMIPGYMMTICVSPARFGTARKYSLKVMRSEL